jgi:hypothetical protein
MPTFWTKGPRKKFTATLLVALMSYIAIFTGLRFIYGLQDFVPPYGLHAGLELLRFNLFHLETWAHLFATLSIIPVLALFSYQKWPFQLRVFFWVIVPIWFVIHAFVGIMAETRLFLVPQAMIFIPGALIFAQQVPVTRVALNPGQS